MRMAIIINSLKGYGVQKTAIELAKALKSFESNTVDIVVIGDRNSTGAELSGINIFVSGTKMVSRSGKYIEKYVETYTPDIIYTPLLHYGAFLLFLFKIKKPSSSKVVVSAANDIVSSVNNFRTWRVYFFSKLVYKYADFVIAINKKMAMDFKNKFKVKDSKVVTIYNPVFTNRILSLAKEPVEHPFFFEAGIKVVIGVGRLSAQKDFITLIDAFSLLIEPGARLIILGEGGWRRELEERVMFHKLQDKVSFPGFVENPFKYIAKSKVFVLSSIWEGFGNVIVEALACGVNIVSTNCPSGPDEILDGGKYGTIVPMKNPSLMAEAIDESLNKVPDQKLLLNRAMDFEINKIGLKYLKVFEDLLRK